MLMLKLLLIAFLALTPLGADTPKETNAPKKAKLSDSAAQQFRAIAAEAEATQLKARMKLNDLEKEMMEIRANECAKIQLSADPAVCEIDLKLGEIRPTPTSAPTPVPMK